MKQLFFFLLITASAVFADSSSSIAAVISSSSVAVQASADLLDQLLDNPMSILAAFVSFMTALAMLGTGIKKLITSDSLVTKVAKLESDVKDLIGKIDAQHTEFKELAKEMKDSMANKVPVNSYSLLEVEQKELETIVKNEVDKLTNALNELTRIETKLSDMKSTTDENNTQRKLEIRELNEDVRGLRDTIHDDINDVKGLFMKLMLSLRVKDLD